MRQPDRLIERAGRHLNTATLLPGLIATVRDHIEFQPAWMAAKAFRTRYGAVGITVVFFGGLETYEAKHYSVRVVFTGTRPLGCNLPEPSRSSAAPDYCWKANFEAPRPFSVSGSPSWQSRVETITSTRRCSYSAMALQSQGSLGRA